MIFFSLVTVQNGNALKDDFLLFREDSVFRPTIKLASLFSYFFSHSICFIHLYNDNTHTQPLLLTAENLVNGNSM